MLFYTLSNLASANGDASSAFKVSDSVPEGFEDVDTRDTTVVDVYFGGRLVKTALASFDTDYIEFSEPEALLLQLPLAETSREQVLTTLKGELPSNFQNLCRESPQPGCGTLKPAVAGVLFDIQSYRVDLFVAKQHLETRYVKLDQFLPPATSGLSMALNLSGTFSGGEGQDIYRLVADSTSSFKSTSLHTRISANSLNDESIEALSLSHVHRDWQAEAGVLTQISLLSGMMRSADFVGARWRKTLRTRTDLRLVSSTPLFVSLGERSRVDLIKDGFLRGTYFLDVGNHQLDTSMLPDGTYPLIVKVSNASGEEEQEQLFSRITGLPPRGEPQHFLEAGQLRSNSAKGQFFDFGGHEFFHMGTSVRVTDSVGLEGGFLAREHDEDLFQGGVFKFWSDSSFNAAVMRGSAGSTGFRISAALRKELWSTSLNFREIDSGVPDWSTDQNNLRDGREYSATYASRLGKGNVYLRYKDQRSAEGRRQQSSLSYSRTLFRHRDMSADFNSEYTYTDDDESLMFALRLSYSGEKRRAALNGHWRDSEQYGSRSSIDARFSVDTQRDDMGFQRNLFYVNQTDDVNRAGARTDFHNDVTHVTAEVQKIEGESSLLYSADFNTGLLVSGKKVTVSQQGQVQSGVVIDLGEEQEESFDVLVNGRRMRTVDAPWQRGIALNPFETYQLAVVPRGDKLFSYEEPVQEVTLYPGNVASLDWDMKSVFVLIGRAMTEGGQPVGNARILNLGGYSATDESGWFQVELEETKTLQLRTRKGLECEIHLADSYGEETLVVLDEVVCTANPMTTQGTPVE